MRVEYHVAESKFSRVNKVFNKEIKGDSVTSDEYFRRQHQMTTLQRTKPQMTATQMTTPQKTTPR
jgi:hypothetical protein